MHISLVLPIYNESDNIIPLYERLMMVFKNPQLERDYTFEMIFVDDGCLDSSPTIIKQLSFKNPSVKLLSFSRNFGHQAALTAGLHYAKGDAVIVLDADLQHPPELIPELITKWREGYDVVYTIRTETEKASLFKRLTAFFYYRFLNFLSGIHFPENTADFRLMDKKVVFAFNQLEEKKRYLRGMTFWLGFKQFGIPYKAAPRLNGVTHYSFKKMVNLAISGITSFTTRPLYLGLFFGSLFFLMTILYSLYLTIAHIFWNIIPDGHTTLIILLVLMSFSLQFFILGIMGIYLGQLFDEVKNRPNYLITEKVGFNEKS